MDLKSLLTDEARKGILWIVAFIGVCVLVGTGHLAPSTVEMMLFSLLGYGASRFTPNSTDKPETKDE